MSAPMNFNPNPQATNTFRETFNQPTFDHMKIHNHLHDGQQHVGDRVITNDFVIRNQFNSNGNLIGGMPEIHPKF